MAGKRQQAILAGRRQQAILVEKSELVTLVGKRRIGKGKGGQDVITPWHLKAPGVDVARGWKRTVLDDGGFRWGAVGRGSWWSFVATGTMGRIVPLWATGLR